MSETESDYDDEDLSAPPKKANDSKSTSSATNSNSFNVKDDAEDTLNEELEEEAVSPRRSSVKRKRENRSLPISGSTRSRRQTHDGKLYG